MKKPLPIKPYSFYLLTTLFLHITLCNLKATDNIPTYYYEIDSLNQLVDKCPTDSGKFKILQHFFYRYQEDLDRVKQVGNLAYELIKNNSNQSLLIEGYHIKGYILKCEQKYDSASIMYQKAIQISTGINNILSLALSYYHLGYMNYNLGKYDTALLQLKNATQHFNSAGKYEETIYYPAKYVISIYEQRGLLDSAIAYYDNNLAFIKSKSDTDIQVIVYRSLLNFCLEHKYIGKAIEYLNELMTLSETTRKTTTLIRVYITIGDFFAKQKKSYPTALSYYNKALKIIESDLNKYQDWAFIYNVIGKIHFEEGKDSQALQCNQKCLDLVLKTKHKHNISDAYKELGLSYKKFGNYSSALQCFMISSRTGCQECPAIAFHEVDISIGDVYMLQGKQDSAFIWYNGALQLAEKSKAFNQIAQSESKMGDYYLTLGRYNLAEQYYLASLQKAEKLKDILLAKNIADSLNSLYSKRNNYTEAYKYLQLFKLMSDSIKSMEMQSDVTEFALKLEFEKIKNENEIKRALAEEDIKRQKTFRNSFIIISVLFIGFGIVVFSMYRRKKRDYILLDEKNREIEEKNHEIQLQVEEITSQKNEIERISAELHESDEMKLRFFSNISHEFRTPLTLIINPLQKIIDSKPDTLVDRNQLASIYKNAQHLLDLTNQILDLQKLDAGRLQLELVQADIIEFCFSVIASFESLCNKKDNTIRITANHSKVITWFDKDKTGKVLVNLISNAFKFCYQGTEIEIHLQLIDHYFNISVTDKGIGIPGKQIDKVFKRYYQAPSGNNATGSGIGLAYVKELVGFMNGNISIHSVVDEGTTFKVSFPLKAYKITDNTMYTTIIPNTEKQIVPQKKSIEELNNEFQHEHSVLIIEDNEELRTFIAGLLKTDFKVHMAQDGEEGMAAAVLHIPDVIVSDVMMPKKDGFELCTILKNDECTSHIPIVLITAKDTVQSKIEGYQTGADDYIVKPFDNELLKLKVKNIIATHEAKRKQFDFKSILSAENIKLGNTDKEFIKKCFAVIQKNMDNPSFSVDVLVDEMAFSKRSFYRKIDALTNQSPAELIRSYKMQYAQQLLQNTQMKIFEVASAVGYDNIKSFSQSFKNQFGFPPSEKLTKTVD